MENDKKEIVTFGEVMLRMSTPGFAKFSQVDNLNMDYGGGEANVAISLAYMGMNAIHVTRFPNNYVGRAAAQFLRHHWVNTSQIIYGDNELGLYFLETGAVHRSSKVVYNRENSSFSKIRPDMIDWEEILKGKDWFHWTGITPAISEGVAASCLKAIEAANKLNVKVSADITYRKSLWQYGKKPQEVMPELVAGCDVIMASAYDLADIFDYPLNHDPETDFPNAAAKLMEDYPRIQRVAYKTRDSLNASHNRISAHIWDGKQLISTDNYDITHIVDRVGTGDAFAAGLIYGLLHYKTDEEAINFAAAACALKHTIEGDANMVDFDDVEKLVKGDKSGGIVR
ncbi:MAG: 2-dehydro-3-deoxygluconokinase [Thalassobius sp.]|nr:2-dehydro-3-deoxygluconokinase [Thalassovita sp.]